MGLLFRKCVAGFFMVIASLQASLVKAQAISIDVSGEPLEQVFSTLREQYGFHFIYTSSTLAGLPAVSIQVQTASIQHVLDRLLENLPITYTVRNKTVVISRRQNSDSSASLVPVRGRVFDALTTQPVTDATIQLVGRHAVTATRADGTFELWVPKGVDTIRLTSIGYQPHIQPIGSGYFYEIFLQPLITAVDEVVVTGIVQRNRRHYTSATTTITGTELRQISNGNAINSIRTLDPSFVLVPNNLAGSDPNLFGQIELRGKTSIPNDAIQREFATDPNLPLFILDGFETTLQQISDLDINRIASITLLKDAASSAMYGARSANGVVVVETLKPSAGKIKVFYRADLGVELADLSDYNLMNAAEKLEFERLSGRYMPDTLTDLVDKHTLDLAYNNRLLNVLRGVDQYWLDKGVQPGLLHNHSLYLQGGNATWQYGFGGNYRDKNGVMIGSGRNAASGVVDLVFRAPALTIQSKSSLYANLGFDSPVNSFSNYARQSPHYTATDTAAYLWEIPYPNRPETYREPNYLYNARLGSYAQERTHTIIQHLVANWQISPGWQLEGRLQVGGEYARADTFLSPKDTRYEQLNMLERGEYTHHRKSGYNYQGSLMGIWHRKLTRNQHLMINIRTEIMEFDVNNRGFRLRGFPENAQGKPLESYQFAQKKKEHLSSPPKTRRVNALISGNYHIDNRYFIDANIRVDGSTQFGSANRYSGFWSAGIGWNIHNERFVQERWKSLSLFRLRINSGLTGNQGFGSFASTVSYNLISRGSVDGLIHHSLGNPQLKWQRTTQSNIGLDLELWQGKVSFTTNLFEKFTSPLIATIDLPLSTGISDYSLNVGDLRTRGYEGILRLSPFYQPSGWTMTFGLTALGYTSRYEQLSAVLNRVNEYLREARALTRFRNSYGPDDLWAVRSMGIDPTTGREIFLTETGHYTFEFREEDQVRIGSQRPWAEGVMSCFVGFRRFQVGAYFRYILGASRLNHALYQKVENINFDELSENQDRRALYDRWKEPGDPARFRGITLLEETPISSRFIQKENVLSGESLSASYVWDAAEVPWLRYFGTTQIRLTGYANNFFRLSNILAERGLDYPFSRAYALSLHVSF